MNKNRKVVSKEDNKLYKHNKILAIQVDIAIESFKILLEIGDKLTKEIAVKTLEELKLIEYKILATSNSFSIDGTKINTIFKKLLLDDPDDGFSSNTDINNCWEQLSKYKAMTKSHSTGIDGYSQVKRRKVEANYDQLRQLIDKNN